MKIRLSKISHDNGSASWTTSAAPGIVVYRSALRLGEGYAVRVLDPLAPAQQVELCEVKTLAEARELIARLCDPLVMAQVIYVLLAFGRSLEDGGERARNRHHGWTGARGYHPDVAILGRAYVRAAGGLLGRRVGPGQVTLNDLQAEQARNRDCYRRFEAWYSSHRYERSLEAALTRPAGQITEAELDAAERVVEAELEGHVRGMAEEVIRRHHKYMKG